MPELLALILAPVLTPAPALTLASAAAMPGGAGIKEISAGGCKRWPESPFGAAAAAAGACMSAARGCGGRMIPAADAADDAVAELGGNTPPPPAPAGFEEVSPSAERKPLWFEDSFLGFRAADRPP